MLEKMKDCKYNAIIDLANNLDMKGRIYNEEAFKDRK